MSIFFLKDDSNVPLLTLWHKPQLIKKSAQIDILKNLNWKTIAELNVNEEKLCLLTVYRPLIMAKYRIQSAHLLNLIEKKTTPQKHLINEIEKTLQMAMILKKIYYHMSESDDVHRMILDQAILGALLFKLKYPNHQIIDVLPGNPLSYRQQLRSVIANNNLSRLTGIRIRRFILALVGYEFFSLFRPYITTIELFTNPFFLYLGWVFFLPRLLLNLILLSKQTFPNPLMTKESYSLPWYIRLISYLNLHRRLFELWTDSAWFIGGILLCFVLTGALAPIRPFVTLAMQVSDVILMTIRSHFELQRLYTLKSEYDYSLIHTPNSQDPSYLHALEERIAYEKRVSYLAITNNFLMVIALLPLIPAIAAIHPLIPLLGALLGVMVTIRFYVLNMRTEATQPRTNLSLLTKHLDKKNTIIPAQSSPSLINRLAVPTVIILSPLIFLCVVYSPVASLLISIALLSFLTKKFLQPATENSSSNSYNRILNYNFFKPAELEAPKKIEATESKPGRMNETSTRL